MPHMVSVGAARSVQTPRDQATRGSLGAAFQDRLGLTAASKSRRARPAGGLVRLAGATAACVTGALPTCRMS